MFLLFEDGVHDFDLESLVELVEILDRQIEKGEIEISGSIDPDGLGHFDRLEAVVGVGFVACQQYIHATYPQLVDDPRSTAKDRKLKALQSAPRHSSGGAIAEVINAAANFWKHHDESPDGFPNATTMAVIGRLVPVSADYKMRNVLYELVKPEPARFASLIRLLTEWSDLLIDAHRPTRR